jgi:hypothetical protein
VRKRRGTGKKPKRATRDDVGAVLGQRTTKNGRKKTREKISGKGRGNKGEEETGGGWQPFIATKKKKEKKKEGLMSFMVQKNDNIQLV